MKTTTSRRVPCTYCGTDVPFKEVTQDHVIGESWYTSSAEDLERWKVPACRKCNNQLSAIEKAVLVRLAFCLDPKNEAHRPICERALRAVDPSAAKTPREARHRMALRQKMQRELKFFEHRDSHGIMPSFADNFDAGSRYGVLISGEQYRGLGEKWAKGLYRYHLKKLVPKDATFDVYSADAETERAAFSHVQSDLVLLHRGPDLQVLMHHTAGPGVESTLFSVRIWQRFKMQMAITVGGDPEDEET
jgi:hypothetical protein